MTATLPPRAEGTVTLPDGRLLGYAEYGVPSGQPVLWFHGTPGAKRQIHPETRALARSHEVRLIAVERPGVGESTAHLYRSVAEFAADIAVLADALSVERFSVAGLSGGGPYALACAHELPDRVLAAAVLSGAAPSVGPDSPGGGVVALARYAAPFIARARGVLGFMTACAVRALAPVADPVMSLYTLTMPPGDQRIFSDPETRAIFQQDLIVASRGGMQAMFNDAVLFGRDWGFSLGDIRVPVFFWHGDADNLVPLSHGEHMAALVPGAVLEVRPEEGHLGGLGASREIFAAIARPEVSPG